MTLCQKIISTIFIIFFMTLTTSFADDNQIIPRQILFGNPDKMRVTLSPDGKYIAYIAPYENVLNIWLAPSDNLSKAKAVTHDKGRGIRSYSWAYNNKNILYSQDFNGDENTRVYSYNIENEEVTLLTPESKVKAFILAKSHKIPNEILIGMNERDPKYFDIYRLNLTTLEKKLIYKNEKFTDFLVDDDLNIRFANLLDENAVTEYYQLKDNEWTLFDKISMEDSANTSFIGLDGSGDILYMLDGRDRNTAALKALNLTNNKTTLLAENAKADIDIFMVHPTKGYIQAVAIDYDMVSYEVLDKTVEKDIKFLQNLDRGDLIINSRTLNDDMWLVAYSSDNAPVKYYKYDRKNSKTEFLFTNRKELENYKLAKMIPVVIKSRDGLDLVSYITFPNNVKLDQNNIPERKLPLIINVHGGPWVRDSWGYDPEHQWLSNRGYAVLSINYRGSTGFGKDFVNAGNLEWGGKMHNDLIDGVNWAVQNNIADPKKVAIMGGSYGGYATLVGITMTPDIFACGVDVVGPSSIYTLIKSIPTYWEPAINQFKKRVGAWDTEEEREFLNQRSPLTFVDNIKKPLFIAQGANDPRVKQAEADQIVNVMNTKKIPVIYALYKNEGHGFARPENRISYYALAEHFLADILKGRAEPIGNDLQGADLSLNNKDHVTAIEAKKMIDQAINGNNN